MKWGVRIGLLAFVVLFCRLPVAEGSRGARNTTIAVGSVNAPPAAEAFVREALSDELRAAPGVRLTRSTRARYVATANVTRFDETQGGDRVSLECEVSVFVSDRRGGAIRFVLQGRAAARGPASERLRGTVVRAAVRGALRPLESGLRAQR